MQPLISRAGELAIRRLMQQHRVLLAFDFDGTLAPIVDRPEDASIPPATAQHLAHLARHLPVAVVTGRSVQDVRQRLGFDPAYVVGNHGAEGLHGVVPGPGLTLLRERLHAAAPALAQAGVELEDKGLSLALHYRLARDPRLALQAIGTCLADLPADLATLGGKCVVNVVLRHAPDKGDAILALLQASACDSLLFVGDDLNDEAVFELACSHWLTVRIGQTGPASRAMYFLESPAQMNWLLARIGQHLGSGDAGPSVIAV